MQRGRAAPLRPRHALPALVLVPQREGDVREGAQGRSGLRHRLLGHRAQPAGTTRTIRRPRPTSRPALAAIEKAKAIGAKTQRERDYIDALALLYTDYDKIDYRARLQAYLKAMEALAAKYPDDDEAQIAYAITLNVAASPADKTYAQPAQGRRDPGADLKRQPQHPGVAHYLIHLYDYPAIARRARGRESLRQDRAGGAARPAHAVAHLHPRRLLEGIDRVQYRHRSRPRRQDKRPAKLHARDYMVYAYLQLAQDARRVRSSTR